jgi:hypothetical protein
MKSSSGNFNSIIEEDNRRYKENNPSEGLVMNFMEELEKTLL